MYMNIEGMHVIQWVSRVNQLDVTIVLFFGTCHVV